MRKFLSLLLALLLLAIGLIMLLSASFPNAQASANLGNDPLYFIKRQAVFAALGVSAGILNMAGLTLLSAASAAACLGFLIWNFHPAKVFMGDTGSLFLGGMAAALCFGIDMPILLLPLGLIYWAEILSVVIQVTYFKRTGGKRLFKMSPIHHHFEMCGWSEYKICGVFSAVTVLGGLIAVLCVLYGV